MELARHTRILLLAAGTIGSMIGVAPAGVIAAGEPALDVPRFSEEAIGPPPAPWEFAGLAHQTKPQTHFAIVDDAGTHVLQLHADHSYGNLALLGKRDLTLRTTIAWRWKIDEPNLQANLRSRDGDDAAVKVCVSYEYDTDGLSFSQRTALQLARLNFPTPVPIATLCYVWDHQLPVGTELVNAFTDRIRYIVLETGESNLHHWVNERRNISDDFWKSFGPEFRPKAPDDLPGLMAVLVGADSDNTGAVTDSEVGDIRVGN